MKVSVLISYYNAAAYLPVLLHSLMQQTYTDWELIAVNNQSTDRSSEIIRVYADMDSRIKPYDNTGREGIIQALRIAFSHSNGELISRMDADDIMPLDKLELMHARWKSVGKKHIVTGLVEYFSHEGEVGDGYTYYTKWLNDLTKRSANFSQIYRECVIPSPCWMAHKDDLLACGAFHPDVYPEDYDLCFRFYESGLEVTGIDQILHYWRDYPSRTSRNDPRYADPTFFELKVHYFLKLDRDKQRPLLLWGAGNKGKAIAKLLSKHNVRFRWVSNNLKKIGKDIYGTVIEAEKTLELAEDPQILVALSSPDDRSKAETYARSRNLIAATDVFYLC